jgi:hypothetical protein
LIGHIGDELARRVVNGAFHQVDPSELLFLSLSAALAFKFCKEGRDGMIDHVQNYRAQLYNTEQNQQA